MNNKEDIDNLLYANKELSKLVKKIADKWVKGMDGYSYASDVKITDDGIEFIATPYTSGMGWRLVIDPKYLYDDTNIKLDASNWQSSESEKRRLKMEEEYKLKQNPFVQKWLQIHPHIGSNVEFIPTMYGVAQKTF